MNSKQFKRACKKKIALAKKKAPSIVTVIFAFVVAACLIQFVKSQHSSAPAAPIALPKVEIKK